MPITVKTPDGAVSVQFPDGTPQDVISKAMAQAVGQAPAPQPKPAPQPSGAEVAADIAEQSVRGINRGVNDIVSLPGELIGGAINFVAPGYGDAFKWNNPVSRFMASDDAQAKTEAGRMAGAAARGIGASVIPQAAVLGKGMQLAGAGARTATTTAGQVGQNIARTTAANPAAAVAADTVASGAAGYGQQVAADDGFGPVGQAIIGTAAALAPGAIAGATANTRQVYRRMRARQGEAGAYQRLAETLPQGVDQLADDIAVGNSRSDQVINRRTFDVLGEEMQRHGGDVNAARQATIARVSADEGITPESVADRIRRIAEPHRNSSLMLGEYPAVARADVDQRLAQPRNVDVDAFQRRQDTQTQADFDYLGNNGNTPSAQAVRSAVNLREEELGPSIRRAVENIAPEHVQPGQRPRPATINDVEQMIEASTQTARQEYNTAYNSPINQRMISQRLPRLLEAARRHGMSRAGDVRQAMDDAVNQFYINPPKPRNGMVEQRAEPMMTLRQLQDARTTLRLKRDEYANAGRNDKAQAVGRLYRDVTRLMENASPTWRTANRRWADMSLDRVAAELGDAFAKGNGPAYRQQRREFNALAPEAQNIVRVHWVQQQLDKLDRLPDTNSVSKLFNNDHARNVIRDLFGDAAVLKVTQAIRNARVAETTKGMMGNSRTHARKMAQEQRDADSGLNAAIQLADPKGARNFLLQKLQQIFTENINRPKANIITTRMSDTAQVARHLHNMSAAERRNYALRRPLELQSRAIGTASPLASIDPNRTKKRDGAR